uniref:Uncharacterized protein n=1 Tax=Nelumbo nucifera TaxID=4432 RepID=A0A822YD75_NELNU|nr:TPA_asm: hypothetical protein HUJ06_009268 [Nelumbo nucifera]
MEPGPPVIAKKKCNIVRIVFFMLRKGISKRKLMMDLTYQKKKKVNDGSSPDDETWQACWEDSGQPDVPPLLQSQLPLQRRTAFVRRSP